MEMENKARKFAEKLHAGQFRVDGKTPYIKHLEAVVRLLRQVGVNDEDILSAGWLHDLIEDCGISIELIEKEFGQNVVRIVATLTRDIDRESYNERISNSDYSVQIVKLADTVHNCFDMHLTGNEGLIRRKVEDCESIYFDLAKRICPIFYEMLVEYARLPKS